MGMYTELYLGIELRKCMDKDIVGWLKLNRDGNYEDIDSICPEELKETRLSVLSGCSYYFDAQPHYNFEYNKISESYYLTMGINIKNYGDEINTFLKILEPYIISNGHIGHIRYEEEVYPTILMFDEEIVKKNIKDK